MSFLDILKTRHLASIIGIRNIPEERTARVLQRGNVQQPLYHLHDGPEQRERHAKIKMVPTPASECHAWRDPEFGPWLLGHEALRDVDAHWPNEVGKWEVGGRRGKGKFSATL